MYDYRELRDDHAQVRAELDKIHAKVAQMTASKDSRDPHDPCSAESTYMPGAAPKADGATKGSGSPDDPSSEV